MWNNPSWENLGFFAWDVAATLIPYVPGSYVVRAGTLIAKADDVYKTLKRLDVAERVDLISDGKVMLPYKKMKRLTKGTDLEAHHLIEKRFADVLGIKEGDIISVALDKNSHQKITNRMRDKIPYEMKGADQGRFSTTKANKEDVWRATKETYTELGLEKYIEPVKDMFRSVGFTDFD